MAVAWFESPYETGQLPEGAVARKVAFDAATSQIREAGGAWAETEQEGDRALVRVRAPVPLLNDLATTYRRVADPQSLWVPSFREPNGDRRIPARTLERVTAEVLTDQQQTAIRRRVEEIIAAADRDGYVRLPDVWGGRTARLLAELAKLGYPLDRVSTGTFPTTSVLDDFNRGNSADLGADWTPNPFANAGNKTLVIDSNQIGSGTPEAFSSEWYHASTWGPDMEAYITVTTRPSGSFASSRLDVRLVDPSAGSATADSYRVRFMSSNNDGDVVIARVDNTSETQLGATGSQSWAAGDTIGIEVIDDDITAYHKPSAGSWGVVETRADATYSAGGLIAYHKNDSGATHTADDLGGGTVVGGGDTPIDAQPGSVTVTGVAATMDRGAVNAPETLRTVRSNLQLR